MKNKTELLRKMLLESKCCDLIKDGDIILLYKYLEMIERWNATHNIMSSNAGKHEIITEIIDSLYGAKNLNLNAVSNIIKRDISGSIGDAQIECENRLEVYDAGSGGGLPGVILAIVNPQIKFYLIEANRKKCSFLRLVKSELNLPNIIIQNIRMESLSNLSFIVSKAAFSPPNIVILATCLKAQGHLALWATPMSQGSLVAELAKHGLKWLASKPYQLPAKQERVILLFSKD